MEEVSLVSKFDTGPATLAYVHTGSRDFEKGLTLPLFQAELMFRLNGDFNIELATTQLCNPEVVFFGLFTKPMTASVSGEFSMAGLFLQPYGFYQLTGQSIRPFTNSAVVATDIWGDKIMRLRDKLLKSPSASGKLDLIQSFVSSQPLHPLHPRIITAIHWLQQAEGSQDLVYRLAKVLKVSEKTIHADFRREIGLSPVVYHLLAHFQFSLARLQEPDIRLGDLAHELEYYDQAHFIKRFSALAHMTPGQYRKFLGQYAPTVDPHYIPLR